MEPYQCLQIDPAAQVLNYGQSVFEGMKAQRSATGQIVLFRPQENAARMAQGLELCLTVHETKLSCPAASMPPLLPSAFLVHADLKWHKQTFIPFLAKFQTSSQLALSLRFHDSK